MICGAYTLRRGLSYLDAYASAQQPLRLVFHFAACIFFLFLHSFKSNRIGWATTCCIHTCLLSMHKDLICCTAHVTIRFLPFFFIRFDHIKRGWCCWCVFMAESQFDQSHTKDISTYEALCAVAWSHCFRILCKQSLISNDVLNRAGSILTVNLWITFFSNEKNKVFRFDSKSIDFENTKWKRQTFFFPTIDKSTKNKYKTKADLIKLSVTKRIEFREKDKFGEWISAHWISLNMRFLSMPKDNYQLQLIVCN